MRLLLGSGGLSTPERLRLWVDSLTDFLADAKDILFVPYALADHDAYLAKMIERGLHAGRTLTGIHRTPDPKRAVREAKALFVGGGNTFRLLYDLYRHDLLDTIRSRVQSGELLYVGISAGTNVACPTLKTTNDMPIVMPRSFEALGLVPFQINAHYFAGPLHYEMGQGLVPYGGETRDDRIREFHEMNETPVLGLWEGSILKKYDEQLTLLGQKGARLFRRGAAPIDLQETMSSQGLASELGK